MSDFANRARAEALSDDQFGRVRSKRDQKTMAGAFILGAQWAVEQEPTDEQVDAAAQEMCDQDRQQWESLMHRHRQSYRASARRVLDATREAGR